MFECRLKKLISNAVTACHIFAPIFSFCRIYYRSIKTAGGFLTKKIITKKFFNKKISNKNSIFKQRNSLTSSHPETRTSPHSQLPIYRHFFERLFRENWIRYQFTYFSLIKIKDAIKCITNNIFKFRSL